MERAGQGVEPFLRIHDSGKISFNNFAPLHCNVVKHHLAEKGCLGINLVASEGKIGQDLPLTLSYDFSAVKVVRAKCLNHSHRASNSYVSLSLTIYFPL